MYPSTYRPRTVLITGATSGYGEAMAQRFAQLGCSLILHGRAMDKLQALAAKLPAVPMHLMLADLFDEGAIEAAIKAIPPEFQTIDLLINNAGGAIGLDTVDTLQMADVNAMIDANVRSMVHITRLITAGMVQRKRGHIINIASVAANWPYPGGNVYCACKAFVKQFSLAIRCDLPRTNIRVTSIEPGISETTFSLKRFKGDAERAANVYKGTTPLTAEDIAESVLWVATLPEHVNINVLEVMPTKQSWSPFAVERE